MNYHDLGRDLTELAQRGKLDRVVGRDREMEGLLRVLCRRTKSNPLLLGDPGVGKTALVDGLAQRIAANAVPAPLQGRRVFELRLGSLLAGTQYRGDLEKRVDEVLKAAQAIGAIVFIDEIHLLMQAGKGSGLDVGNLLKPALARGDFSCIGATTPAEAADFFRLDPAFERRFQSLVIEEPDPAALIAILRESARKLSSFHRVTIDDSAIVAAANAPSRATGYGARKNPDRALDLLEDACAAQQLQWCHEELNTPNVPPDVLTLKKQVDEAAAQLNVFRHIENRAAYDDALAAWHRSKTPVSRPAPVIGAKQILAVLKTRESPNGLRQEIAPR